MRIYIFRHGFSEGNDDLANYNLRGDPNIELHNLGHKQAVLGGYFLGNELLEKPSDKPVRMYYSPYMRTRQTGAGLIHGAQVVTGNTELFLPEHCKPSRNLVEQDFGIKQNYPNDAVFENVAPLLAEFTRVRKDHGKYWSRIPLGESPADVQLRTQPLIGTIMRDKDNGYDTFVLVTHGVTLRAFIMEFMKIDTTQYDNFQNPENCSGYLIEGDPDKGQPYSVHQVYNGEKGMPLAEPIDIGEQLGAYKSTLPEVPKNVAVSIPRWLRERRI